MLPPNHLPETERLFYQFSHLPTEFGCLFVAESNFKSPEEVYHVVL